MSLYNVLRITSCWNIVLNETFFLSRQNLEHLVPLCFFTTSQGCVKEHLAVISWQIAARAWIYCLPQRNIPAHNPPTHFSNTLDKESYNVFIS